MIVSMMILLHLKWNYFGVYFSNETKDSNGCLKTEGICPPMFKSIRALDWSSPVVTKLLDQRKLSGNQSPSIMSLGIFAKVAYNGVTVVDSQTLLIRIASGGQITLTFGSADEMMGAAEAMAFSAGMVTPTILVPTTPLSTNNNEVVAIDDTPPGAAPRDQNSGSENLDNSDVSRDMLASASDEDEDSEDAAEAEDTFEEEALADGVRRVKINENHDDSFEDTIGLTQEFF
jgi:hypothetical protein